MRISELSRLTGISVPTVKYYIREGLLPQGSAVARNQAHYDDFHVHRLRLIRILREVGGLGIAQVRAVLAAVADEQLPMHELLGVGHRALGPPPDAGPVPDDVVLAREEVDGFLAELGWEVGPGAPARRTLADALVALRRLGRDCGPEVFAPYAEAAGRIAEQELAGISGVGGRAEAVEWMVVGTVVFEAALGALRRLAQEHYSSRLAQASRERIERGSQEQSQPEGPDDGRTGKVASWRYGSQDRGRSPVDDLGDRGIS